ncbi:MAG: hypothetical protein ACOYB1_09875 [Limnohabitans sp.]
MSPTEIDLILQSSQQSAAFSLDGVQLSRARAHALLLVLLSGGAGMGSLGLALWAANAGLAVVLLAAATCWFVAAAWLAVKGLTSAVVRAWSSSTLLEGHAEWCRYRDELVSEGQLGQADNVDVLHQLKLSAVRAANRAKDEYITASSSAFDAIDQVYKAMAATPVFGLVAWLVFTYL